MCVLLVVRLKHKVSMSRNFYATLRTSSLLDSKYLDRSVSTSSVAFHSGSSTWRKPLRCKRRLRSFKIWNPNKPRRTRPIKETKKRKPKDFSIFASSFLLSLFSSAEADFSTFSPFP